MPRPFKVCLVHDASLATHLRCLLCAQGLGLQDSFSSVATERSAPSPRSLAGTAAPAAAAPDAGIPGQAQQQAQHAQQLLGRPGSGPATHLRQDSAESAGAPAPSPFVLPAGQRCTAVVSIRNHAPCEVRLPSTCCLCVPAALLWHVVAPDYTAACLRRLHTCYPYLRARCACWAAPA